MACSFLSADGDYTFGWQQWYSGNGFNTATGEDGIGDSFHISSFPGASIELTFFGMLSSTGYLFSYSLLRGR